MPKNRRPRVPYQGIARIIHTTFNSDEESRLWLRNKDRPHQLEIFGTRQGEKTRGEVGPLVHSMVFAQRFRLGQEILVPANLLSFMIGRARTNQAVKLELAAVSRQNHVFGFVQVEVLPGLARPKLKEVEHGLQAIRLAPLRWKALLELAGKRILSIKVRPQSGFVFEQGRFVLKKKPDQKGSSSG